MDRRWRDTLFHQAMRFGIELSKTQITQFEQYYEMLVEKNKVMNLTAITEPYEVIEKHFIDSLSIANLLPMVQVSSVLDLGTGAGFPGIPLKIAFPHLNITLLDSLNKRIQFLDEVIEALQLEKIEGIHGRAEDIAKKGEYREQYDLCVSRAVANLSTLGEYCIPFVKIDGLFVAYKGERVEEEMQGIKKTFFVLGAELERVEEFQLPDTDMNRKMIFVRKFGKTPRKYPRKAGLPSKEPLFRK